MHLSRSLALSVTLALGFLTALEALAAAPASQTAPGAALRPSIAAAGRQDLSPSLGHLSPAAEPAMVSRFRTKRWARLPRHRQPGVHLAVDPAVQLAPGPLTTPSTSSNFEGLSSDGQAATVGVVLPPDTNADVGPSHIVQWVNLTFAVYDKATGRRLYGPVPGNTLWQGFGGPCETSNDGDPIVLYDHLADRWLMSQLAVPNFPDGPFYQCVAISQTGDPLGSYHRYEFKASDTLLNDYPKFGVWPDGYYLAVNQYSCFDALPPFGFYSCSWGGQGAMVFEREEMLSGRPARMLKYDVPASNLGGMLPADLDGPAPPGGTPNYFVQVDDDAWLTPNDPWGPDVDRLQVWAFHVDWVNPAGSTFTQVGVIQTAPFDSDMCGGQTNCIPQPGVDILGYPSPPVDALADRLMYRLQYRNFGSYQTLMLNHTVDVDGTDHAGIRWYELRTGCATAGTPFCIHQQGTYAPGDGNHRWMGSIAMDGAGNIALGYSVASLSTYPSIRYAGQMAGDAPGQLGTEERIVDGTGYQLHSAGRWGDYSTMSVDPTDDCTFWYTQEYYQSVDIWYGANWQTRIASFRFPSCGSGLPALSIDDVSVTEGNAGNTVATFTVTRSGPTDTEVTVSYATADGSATAGVDYTGTSGALTFGIGETTQSIPVPVHGDTVYEGDETFVVNLSGASGAVIADSQGVGTILNDDVAGIVSVIAPNGGETWTVGANVTILWDSSGMSESDNVKIELSRNGGSSYEVLFANTPNDGHETWTVGGKTTNRALIRIGSVDAPTVADTSNGMFSIVKSGGKPRGR